MKAILKRQYDRKQRALAILRAVQPDNLKTPEGIRINTTGNRNSITVTIECSKGLGTLTSTLDDLLSCVGAAERTMQALT